MKFNFLRKRTNDATITNYEGEKAFVLTPELELYTAVATAALSYNFYEKATDCLQRLRELIAKNDAVFVAKLAVYAREKMYLRIIPMVLVVELAKLHNGDDLVQNLTARIVQRADEITELLSYYALANERTSVKQLNKLSKQIQKGLSAAFNRFDEYQFAKYNRDANIKLKDALFLVHPKAKDELQQALFNKIAKDELQTPYTWEVELSKLGQKKYDSAEVKAVDVRTKWEELISSNKLGYMATLRNLRNMLEADINNEALNAVCNYLSNANAVAKSKQLPFRFLSAYRELKIVKHMHVSKVLEALETAVLHSAANIKGYDQNTSVVIAADVSGSMQTPVSEKSKVQRYDIGLLLAMLLQNRCEAVMTGIFGDRWKVVNLPKANILGNVEALAHLQNQVGFSTNGYLVVKDLLQHKQVVDKVMLFTDCQLWNSKGFGVSLESVWKPYKQIAPKAKLYLFDLAGYGNTPLSVQHHDVHLIAGWSDKIFEVLAAIEEGGSALDIINAIELTEKANA